MMDPYNSASGRTWMGTTQPVSIKAGGAHQCFLGISPPTSRIKLLIVIKLRNPQIWWRTSDPKNPCLDLIHHIKHSGGSAIECEVGSLEPALPLARALAYTTCRSFSLPPESLPGYTQNQVSGWKGAAVKCHPCCFSFCSTSGFALQVWEISTTSLEVSWTPGPLQRPKLAVDGPTHPTLDFTTPGSVFSNVNNKIQQNDFVRNSEIWGWSFQLMQLCTLITPPWISQPPLIRASNFFLSEGFHIGI